jgi:hypothetical protein
MTRFILYVSMTFITAFVGVSWAARGFPVHLSSPLSIEPVRPTLTTSFRDGSDDKRREQLVEEQLQNPENAKRNPLRADALQAATGFAMSPCDQTMKANLVGAAGAYALAFSEIRKCNPLFSNCEPVLDKNMATYSTPYDLRVREALHAAFEKGGISKADFPPELQLAVLTLASSQGSPVSACEISAERDRP